jgi:hypothetical protein
MITGDKIQRTDEEMLRLAAYALTHHHGKELPEGWNPLLNDLDAFRLSVALKIGVSFGGISLTAKARVRDDWWAQVWFKNDEFESTRQAIVAVAAMQGHHFETLPPDWWKKR